MSHFCYTCLSQDRELKPVETLYTKPTLSEWFKDSSFKVNVDRFQLCWECFALIIKLSKFKRQVFTAQRIRLKVQKKKSARLVSQTKLCVYTKEMYDSEYVFEECGTEITQTKKQTSKRKKHGRPKTKTKRKKVRDPDSEPKESVPNIYNIYNYFNSPYIKTETSKNDIEAKEKTKRMQEVVDLTKDSSNVPNIKKETSENGIEAKEKTKSIQEVFDLTKDSPNVPNIKIETSENVIEAKEKTKRVQEVVDLTKDPKLSAMAVVIIDKEIKQEMIDAYEAETENKNSTPAIFVNTGQSRPSVIMTVIPPDDAETNWEGSSLKFTIVNLTEDQMLKNRELDRSERVYMKHFLKCESCVIGFAEETELDKHNKEKHNELIGNFECPICATRFNNECLLTRHEKTHYFSFKCRQCDFEHHRRYVIEMHVVKEHDLTPSPVCAACDTEFDTQQRLNAHFEKAHKERLKCNQCAQSFNTVDRLKDHATSHKEKDEVVEIFPCDPCQSIFEGKAAYRAHVQCVHKELAKHAYCGQCDLQFNTLKKFKHHIRDHSLFDQMKLDLPSSSSKDTLAGDMKRVHRMLSHTCGLCKKGFSDEMRLKEHIQQKHPQVVTTKPAKDKITDLSPATSPPLQDLSFSGEQHSEVVTIVPAKDKSCPICSKGFVTRIALLHHMRTHKAKKHFKCDVCDKSFVTEMMLRKHFRTHASD